MTEIDDDTEALLMKRVYDMAGTVRDVKVFLNDERLKVKGFKQVCHRYLPILEYSHRSPISTLTCICKLRYRRR